MMMSGLKQALYRLNPWLLSSIAGTVTVLQIAFCLFRANPQGLVAVRYVGYVLWTVAVAFAIVPIFTLRRRGGVAKGESYMKTTNLVTTGVYPLVRHPQGGLAWLLMNMAAILIGQTWTMAVLGLVSMPLVCLDTLKTDQSCIEKFGYDYEQYMRNVPAVNLPMGIISLLRRRRSEQGELNSG
jgi:protein-S-isoprenylcysteine O-methyltransferase Ste14